MIRPSLTCDQIVKEIQKNYPCRIIFSFGSAGYLAEDAKETDHIKKVLGRALASLRENSESVPFDVRKVRIIMNRGEQFIAELYCDLDLGNKKN